MGEFKQRHSNNCWKGHFRREIVPPEAEKVVTMSAFIEKSRLLQWVIEEMTRYDEMSEHEDDFMKASAYFAHSAAYRAVKSRIESGIYDYSPND